MKRFVRVLGNWLLLFVVVALPFFTVSAQPAYAANPPCTDFGFTFSDAPPESVAGGTSFSFTVEGLVTTKSYRFELQKYTMFGNDGSPSVIGNISGQRTATINAGPPATNIGGSYDINVIDTATGNACELAQMSIESSDSCDISVEQAGFSDTNCVDAESGEMTISVTNIFLDGQLANDKPVHVAINQEATQHNETAFNGAIPNITFTPNGNRVGDQLTIEVSEGGFFGGGTLCRAEFDLIQACDDEDRTAPDADTQFILCDQIPRDAEAYQKCRACVGGAGGGPSEVPQGIWTAVGCIKNDPQSIVTVVIKVGMGIAGGVALLMILAASFTLTTSQGDAKKTAEGREMISSAVIGLIFIVMAVTVLEFIGVKIFRIPGLGG